MAKNKGKSKVSLKDFEVGNKASDAKIHLTMTALFSMIPFIGSLIGAYMYYVFNNELKTKYLERKADFKLSYEGNDFLLKNKKDVMVDLISYFKKGVPDVLGKTWVVYTILALTLITSFSGMWFACILNIIILPIVFKKATYFDDFNEIDDMFDELDRALNEDAKVKPVQVVQKVKTMKSNERKRIAKIVPKTAKAKVKKEEALVQTDEQISELDDILVEADDDEVKGEDVAKVVKSKSLDKSGYVYVIGNRGSFGKGIYKIGLTRRAEPSGRIKELNSASVPFKFELHALVYSKNAVDLERKLHEAFDGKRLNRVNKHKEFFKVSLKEIKRELDKYDDTVDWDFNKIDDSTAKNFELLGKKAFNSNLYATNKAQASPKKAEILAEDDVDILNKKVKNEDDSVVKLSKDLGKSKVDITAKKGDDDLGEILDDLVG